MLLKKNIPLKYIFGKIKTELIVISVIVVTITSLHELFGLHISIPIAVPMILGTVLSLLLGFRSNQAYDRWWEARTIWGGIVNDSRSFARQITSFINSDFDNGEKMETERRIINRQIAWCYALGRSLRGKSNARNLSDWLRAEDMEFINRFNNVPMALLELQAREIRYALDCGWINAYQHVTLDNTLTQFSNHMGKCERIKNTVFPATYSLYLHLTMLLFVCLLPFGLIDIFDWLTIPLAIAIAAAFFLIEKMAIHLQDPFENKPTDTPVTTIAKTIERDLKQVIRESGIIDNAALPKESKRRFFVM